MNGLYLYVVFGTVHLYWQFLLLVDDPDVIALLEKFAVDPEPIVSQSCEVALKRIQFERSGKPFEIKFEIEVVRSGKAFEHAFEGMKQLLEGMKQVNLEDN